MKLRRSRTETAKDYAKSNNIFLSKLIESYLGSLTQQKTQENEITPLVKSLNGVISIDEDYDEKDEYAQFLMEKYK